MLSESLIDPAFFLSDFYDFCEQCKIKLLDESITVADVTEQHGDPVEAKTKLISLFKPPGCDGIDSSMDKGSADAIQREKTFIATAFGYEKFYLRYLDCLRKILSTRFDFDPAQYLDRRQFIKSTLRRIFSKALGETRRGANDVTLWDHSYSVGTLYKSLISWIILSKQNVPEITEFVHDGKWEGKLWRLLSIRTDGLGYLLSANSIPDLLVRKDLLTDAWNRVQVLLEERYPLGLEVYRDENGPVFVVPDIDNLLDLTDSDHYHRTLREFILEAFRQGTVKGDPCLAINGEIAPCFNLDKEPWDGQSKLPPIGKDHLKETPPLQTDPQWVAEQWCPPSKHEEVCTVCGLRPQGPGQKAKARKMCDICEERRSDRAKEWAASTGKTSQFTIWLDEVADQNGRIALLVGTFDLTHWLDGTLVRSLAVREPNDQNGHTAKDVAKNPSFARLRRIWETTKRFWEETLEEAKASSRARSRLFLKGSVQNGSLGPYHTYELEIQGRKVAVLWVPPDEKGEDNDLQHRGGFWIIENLAYLDKIFERSFQNLVQSLEGQPLRIFEPSEYGRPGEARATFTIDLSGVQLVESAYVPLILILAEPRTFMALVPAEDTFDVLMKIKTKYGREMGKVRNRLPLYLGAVFADSHQPLRTLLDAGRRMLKQEAKPLVWEMMCSARKQINKGDDLPAQFEVDKQGHFKEWYEVTLRNEAHQVVWYIPAVMGDGQTEDHWYPYVFLASPHEPPNRHRYYETDMGNPWNQEHNWLVHAGELQPGDRVYFTPATFDFIWLDHGGRRFEIAYDNQGKRCGTLHRPYLLDELPNLKQCWDTLHQGLSARQIHQIQSLIEGRREQWFLEDANSSLSDLTFRRFCEATLHNAEWKKKPSPSEDSVAYVVG